MKKVSVIVTCFNKAPYLKDCLNSVLNSTYKNLEIVCFNDDSTDDSLKILKDYENKYEQVKVIDSKTNRGVIYARNYSIDVSSGEYILPLDADDMIAPTYIEKAVKVLEENDSIGVVYSKALNFNCKRYTPFKLDPFNKVRMLFKNVVFHCALFRKSDFIKVGKYNENMYIGDEDYDLWLSFIEHGFDFYRIDEGLFIYRTENNTRTSISRKNTNFVKKQLVLNHPDLFFINSTFVNNAFTIKNLFYKKRFHLYKLLFIVSSLVNLSLLLLFALF